MFNTDHIKCRKCDKTFKTQQEFNDHILRNHADNPKKSILFFKEEEERKQREILVAKLQARKKLFEKSLAELKKQYPECSSMLPHVG